MCHQADRWPYQKRSLRGSRASTSSIARPPASNQCRSHFIRGWQAPILVSTFVPGACMRCRRMSVLSLLLNIAWIVCGGLWMALGWIVAAVIMVVTIVGIPWAKAAFNIAVYTLLPFGQKAVSRADYSGQEDVGTGL